MPSWLENPVVESAEKQRPSDPTANEEAVEESPSVELKRRVETKVPERKRDKRQGTPEALEESEVNEDQALPSLGRPKRDKRLPPRLAGYQL